MIANDPSLSRKKNQQNEQSKPYGGDTVVAEENRKKGNQDKANLISGFFQP